MDIAGPNLMIPDQIVVATDFSPASTTALLMAGRVARIFKVKVTIVHVFQYPVRHRYPVPVGWMVEMVRRDLNVKLNEARQLIEEMNLQTEGVMIQNGFTSDEILGFLRSSESPLLVMGTHAVGGMDRFFLGSTAEEILRKARCPVITVGPHVASVATDDPCFHKVLYATDFSAASIAAAPLAMMLRQSSATSITVLHVIDSDSIDHPAQIAPFEAVRIALGNAGNSTDGSAEYVTLHGKDISQAIVNEAERYPADLVVLGVHRASAFASHLAPKIAFQVIAAAPCAVLTASS